MIKITDEQRKLVEENHNLIYSFLYSNQFSLEEHYDVAAIGLCKAAINFNPNKGYSFATYAYKSMMMNILQELRKGKNAKSIPEYQIYYYQAKMKNDEEDTNSHLNYLPAKENVENDVITQITFEKCLESFKDKEKQMILLLSNGYTQREVGRKLGCSQPQVCRVKNKLLKMWKM